MAGSEPPGPRSRGGWEWGAGDEGRTPGEGPETLDVGGMARLVLPNTPMSWVPLVYHSTDKETEAQQFQVTSLRSHARMWKEEIQIWSYVRFSLATQKTGT